METWKFTGWLTGPKMRNYCCFVARNDHHHSNNLHIASSLKDSFSLLLVQNYFWKCWLSWRFYVVSMNSCFFFATKLHVMGNPSNCTLSGHTRNGRNALTYCSLFILELCLVCVTHPWPPIYCNVIVFRRHQRRYHDCRQLSQPHVPSDRTDLRLKGIYWVHKIHTHWLRIKPLTNTIVFAQNIIFDESTYTQILPQNFRTELRPILWHFLWRSRKVECEESKRR